MVIYAYNLRYSVGRVRRIATSRPVHEKLVRNCVKNNIKIKQQKKSWEHSSSGKALA
jgi:hypothetical protein